MITTRRHHTLRRAITLALVAGATTATSLAVPGIAFGAEEELETVIVTGSNIRRADIETASPVQVVTREDIDRTGKSTLGEYLQTLTADGAGSVPKSFGTGFAAGAAGVSLRGLGAGSTLVLLNGRRIAPYGLADDGQKIFTDLSVIPLETVERVEVLKDGASAIYGSDAIAGVVNIILRDELQGLSAKASYAASEEGDGNTSKLSITGGLGDLRSDGYNVYFNVEGSQSEEIRVSDRRDRKHIGSGDLRPYGYSATRSQFLTGFIDGNTITNSPTGGVLTPVSNLPRSLPGCAQFSEVPQDGSGGGCLWEAGRFRWLTPKQEYVNVFGKGTFSISEAFEATAELGYSRKKNEFANTPSGVSGSWGYPGGLQNASSGPGATLLGANHPDNEIFPGQAVRFRYSAWDVGPRMGEQTNEFYRALVGLKGSIGEWDVEVAALHSESDLLSERKGFLRYSAVQQALSGTGGPIVWRVGDNAGLNSQEVYDYISPDLHADGKNQMDSVDVKVSRGLFDLPGGELGFAVGAEYRRLEASLTPQTYTDTGDIIGLGYSSFDGTENSIGAYVEVLAPVLEQVEVSLAVRHDSYMNSEAATTPKFGVKWSPLDMISLRGTYAEGFRIPNAAETGGIAAGFANARDPVRCPGGTPLPGASAADCNASVAVVTRSGAALEPEESESYTVGVVFSPFDNTTLTVDAWQIERTNEIRGETLVETIARGDVIRNDVDLPGIPNSGQLLAANANYINAESTKVKGIDVALNQAFDLPMGRLSFDVQWARINSYAAIQSDGSEVEYAGTHGNCDVTNCIGTPKNRVNVGATWSLTDLSLGAVVNYRGEMTNNDSEGETCTNQYADGRDAPGGCKIAAFYSINLTGRWQATEAMQLFGTVENLTDRIAPLDPHTYGAVNYNPLDASGAIGRYFTLGLSYSF